MIESHDLIEIVSANYKIALRVPGRETVRAECVNWAAINDWVSGHARKRNYPVGTVLAVPPEEPIVSFDAFQQKYPELIEV